MTQEAQNALILIIYFVIMAAINYVCVWFLLRNGKN